MPAVFVNSGWIVDALGITWLNESDEVGNFNSMET